MASVDVEQSRDTPIDQQVKFANTCFTCLHDGSCHTHSGSNVTAKHTHAKVHNMNGSTGSPSTGNVTVRLLQYLRCLNIHLQGSDGGLNTYTKTILGLLKMGQDKIVYLFIWQCLCT